MYGTFYFFMAKISKLRKEGLIISYFLLCNFMSICIYCVSHLFIFFLSGQYVLVFVRSVSVYCLVGSVCDCVCFVFLYFEFYRPVHVY